MEALKAELIEKYKNGQNLGLAELVFAGILTREQCAFEKVKSIGERKHTIALYWGGYVGRTVSLERGFAVIKYKNHKHSLIWKNGELTLGNRLV